MATTPIEELHPELFHYTGIKGLVGILDKQTLIATNPLFLNDQMELREYKKAMPESFRPLLQRFIAESIKVPDSLALIELKGGKKKFLEELEASIVEGMDFALRGNDSRPAFMEFYISSFCTPKNEQIREHGLLSQWRAYGHEGGYAIVFDTAKLVNLLEQEKSKWGPEYFLICDNVSYSSPTHEIFRERFSAELGILSNSFSKYFLNNDLSQLENVVEPLIKCACLYKHWGFHEEKEVRIIAAPPRNPSVLNQLKRDSSYNEKELRHFVRKGTPVPCLHLFEEITKQPANHLPIKRIIVGPHRDKEKRQSAVKSLLRQFHLDYLSIEVSHSEIPYIQNYEST